MKVLLDTNIIMDALQERQPFDVEAKEILKIAQSGAVTAIFTANAVTDIFTFTARRRIRRRYGVRWSFFWANTMWWI